MCLHKATFELTMITVIFQNSPGFLHADQFHTFEQIVRHARTPIIKAIKRIEFGEVDQVFLLGLNAHVGCLHL